MPKKESEQENKLIESSDESVPVVAVPVEPLHEEVLSVAVPSDEKLSFVHVVSDPVLSTPSEKAVTTAEKIPVLAEVSTLEDVSTLAEVPTAEAVPVLDPQLMAGSYPVFSLEETFSLESYEEKKNFLSEAADGQVYELPSAPLEEMSSLSILDFVLHALASKEAFKDYALLEHYKRNQFSAPHQMSLNQLQSYLLEQRNGVPLIVALMTQEPSIALVLLEILPSKRQSRLLATVNQAGENLLMIACQSMSNDEHSFRQLLKLVSNLTQETKCTLLSLNNSKNQNVFMLTADLLQKDSAANSQQVFFQWLDQASREQQVKVLSQWDIPSLLQDEKYSVDVKVHLSVYHVILLASAVEIPALQASIDYFVHHSIELLQGFEQLSESEQQTIKISLATQCYELLLSLSKELPFDAPIIQSLEQLLKWMPAPEPVEAPLVDLDQQNDEAIHAIKALLPFDQSEDTPLQARLRHLVTLDKKTQYCLFYTPDPETNTLLLSDAINDEAVFGYLMDILKTFSVKQQGYLLQEMVTINDNTQSFLASSLWHSAQTLPKLMSVLSQLPKELCGELSKNQPITLSLSHAHVTSVLSSTLSNLSSLTNFMLFQAKKVDCSTTPEKTEPSEQQIKLLCAYKTGLETSLTPHQEMYLRYELYKYYKNVDVQADMYNIVSKFNQWLTQESQQPAMASHAALSHDDPLHSLLDSAYWREILGQDLTNPVNPLRGKQMIIDLNRLSQDQLQNLLLKQVTASEPTNDSMNERVVDLLNRYLIKKDNWSVIAQQLVLEKDHPETLKTILLIWSELPTEARKKAIETVIQYATEDNTGALNSLFGAQDSATWDLLRQLLSEEDISTEQVATIHELLSYIPGELHPEDIQSEWRRYQSDYQIYQQLDKLSIVIDGSYALIKRLQHPFSPPDTPNLAQIGTLLDEKDQKSSLLRKLSSSHDQSDALMTLIEQMPPALQQRILEDDPENYPRSNQLDPCLEWAKTNPALFKRFFKLYDELGLLTPDFVCDALVISQPDVFDYLLKYIEKCGPEKQKAYLLHQTATKDDVLFRLLETRGCEQTSAFISLMKDSLTPAELTRACQSNDIFSKDRAVISHQYLDKKYWDDIAEQDPKQSDPLQGQNVIAYLTCLSLSRLSPEELKKTLLKKVTIHETNQEQVADLLNGYLIQKGNWLPSEKKFSLEQDSPETLKTICLIWSTLPKDIKIKTIETAMKYTAFESKDNDAWHLLRQLLAEKDISPAQVETTHGLLAGISSESIPADMQLEQQQYEIYQQLKILATIKDASYRLIKRLQEPFSPPNLPDLTEIASLLDEEDQKRSLLRKVSDSPEQAAALMTLIEKMTPDRQKRILEDNPENDNRSGALEHYLIDPCLAWAKTNPALFERFFKRYEALDLLTPKFVCDALELSDPAVFQWLMDYLEKCPPEKQREYFLYYNDTKEPYASRDFLLFRLLETKSFEQTALLIPLIKSALTSEELTTMFKYDQLFQFKRHKLRLNYPLAVLGLLSQVDADVRHDFLLRYTYDKTETLPRLINIPFNNTVHNFIDKQENFFETWTALMPKVSGQLVPELYRRLFEMACYAVQHHSAATQKDFSQFIKFSSELSLDQLAYYGVDAINIFNYQMRGSDLQENLDLALLSLALQLNRMKGIIASRRQQGENIHGVVEQYQKTLTIYQKCKHLSAKEGDMSVLWDDVIREAYASLQMTPDGGDYKPLLYRASPDLSLYRTLENLNVARVQLMNRRIHEKQLGQLKLWYDTLGEQKPAELTAAFFASDINEQITQLSDIHKMGALLRHTYLNKHKAAFKSLVEIMRTFDVFKQQNMVDIAGNTLSRDQRKGMATAIKETSSIDIATALQRHVDEAPSVANGPAFVPEGMYQPIQNTHIQNGYKTLPASELDKVFNDIAINGDSGAHRMELYHRMNRFSAHELNYYTPGILASIRKLNPDMLREIVDLCGHFMQALKSNVNAFPQARRDFYLLELAVSLKKDSKDPTQPIYSQLYERLTILADKEKNCTDLATLNEINKLWRLCIDDAQHQIKVSSQNKPKTLLSSFFPSVPKAKPVLKKLKETSSKMSKHLATGAHQGRFARPERSTTESLIGDRMLASGPSNRVLSHQEIESVWHQSDASRAANLHACTQKGMLLTNMRLENPEDEKMLLLLELERIILAAKAMLKPNSRIHQTLADLQNNLESSDIDAIVMAKKSLKQQTSVLTMMGLSTKSMVTHATQKLLDRMVKYVSADMGPKSTPK